MSVHLYVLCVFINIYEIDYGVISTESVANAMLATDRKHYSPRNPYMDAPQPIGGGVTISAPHMVMFHYSYMYMQIKCI